jgi:hypothetical protein
LSILPIEAASRSISVWVLTQSTIAGMYSVISISIFNYQIPPNRRCAIPSMKSSDCYPLSQVNEDISPYSFDTNATTL